MENLVKNYKGVILFYFIIVLLTLVFTFRLNKLNIIGSDTESKVKETICA